MNLEQLKKEAEAEFEELTFASCPTEEKEPFFWRWTDHGKEILNLLMAFQIEKAYEAGKMDYLRQISKEVKNLN